MFDTGSANTILISSDCLLPVCSSKTRYDRQHSKLSKQLFDLSKYYRSIYVKEDQFQGKDAIKVDFATGMIKATISEDLMCLQADICTEGYILESFYMSE